MLKLEYERILNNKKEQDYKIQQLIQKLTEYESELNILRYSTVRLENRMKNTLSSTTLSEKKIIVRFRVINNRQL